MKSYMKTIVSNASHIRKVLELDYTLLSEFNFPISEEPNALHGIPSLASILASMAENRSCANEGSRLGALEAAKKVPVEDVEGIHAPTSQWALGMIGSVRDPDEMEARCGVVDDMAIAAMRAAGMIPESPVGAIDGHNMENYSKRMDDVYTIRSRHKNGTSKFFSAMTSAIVSGPYTIHIGSRLVRRGRPRAEYIGNLLDDHARRGIFCSHYVTDREAFNVASMSEFSGRGDYFLMYARLTPGVKKARDAYKRGDRPAVSEYTVKSDRSKFTGTLVFWKKEEIDENGKKETVVLPFFSNLPRAQLGDAMGKLGIELKRRQRIEIGYSTAEKCMPMTTSNSPAIRTFLFHYSLIDGNLWALADHMIETGGRAGEDWPAEPPQSPKFGSYSWLTRKKYKITYKEFCDMLHSEAAAVIVLPKAEQDAYVAEAVGRFRQRLLDAGVAPAADAAKRVAERAAAAVVAGPLLSCP